MPLIISSKMQVKSYNKSDNARQKPEMWNDSTRGTIYTSPYKTGKAKALPGHKQTRNLYVRKTASLCFYNVASMDLHSCTHICLSQITMAFAHKSVVDKTQNIFMLMRIFFKLCLVAKWWQFQKGKYVVFVNFTEQNICISDWWLVLC